MLFKTIYHRYGLWQIRQISLSANLCVKEQQLMLQKLRKKTGFGIGKCKSALTETNYDLEKAEALLREKAKAERWDVATKLGGRTMSQGLVAITGDKSSNIIVEVNCETDFVARNEKFQELVRKVSQSCYKYCASVEENKIVMNKKAVNAIPSGEDKNASLADMVAMEIGMIGENMALSRATFMKPADSSQHVGTFVQPGGPSLLEDKDCKMGKYGAMVLLKELEESESPKESIAVLGTQLAQHIVGMRPASIGEMPEQENNDDSIDEENEEKRKKKKKKTKKAKADNEIGDNRMLHQEFLFDSSITVGELLQENSLQVLDFVRFECGEEIEMEDEE